MKIPERFLIIDDDPLNNRLCRMALEKAFESPYVVIFTEPETALLYIENEYIKSSADTVIFLDINMPTLSGWEVLDELNNSAEKLNNNFTIFMLSSSIDPADKQKAEDNPLVAGYLEKPLTGERLHAMFNGL